MFINTIEEKIKRAKIEKEYKRCNKLFRESKTYSEYLNKLGIKH